MQARLISITYLSEHKYTVVIGTPTENLSCVCTVSNSGDIRYLNSEPSIWHTLSFDPRLLVNAVLAFDLAAGLSFGGEGLD
jgi:hypothetical protein